MSLISRERNWMTRAPSVSTTETTSFGLSYNKGESERLIAFSDSDYARDVDDRKSTSDYVLMLGSTAVSWSSKKQPVVTLSTTEVEYIATTSCACQCA